MSRSTRRAVSWTAMLAALAGCGVGVVHLPGWSGVAAELHWLLAKNRVPSQPLQFNRAAGLILFAEEHKPGTRVALYKDLLWQRDPQIVRNAVSLLSNELGARHPPDDLLTLFTEWFLASTPEERLRYQPAVLACCEPLLLFRDLDTESQTRARPQPWPLPAAVGDYRWLVAGTLWRQHAGRAFADRLVFRKEADLDWLSLRLMLLDGDAPFLENHRFTPLASDRLAATLRPTVDQVLAMVSDPDERVRWGAGRILAAAGDPRGLPALCDWVKHYPQLMPNTDKLMTALFGPDWRDLCANGSATRQSSAGDGGR